MIGALITLAVVVGSFAYSIGDMKSAVFRSAAAPRFVLADLFALTTLVCMTLAVATINPSVIHRGVAMAIGIVIAFATWGVAILMLSNSGVGTPSKRFAFALSLPWSLVACGSWFLYLIWLTDALVGGPPMSWGTPLSMLGTILCLVLMRRINNWVARVDTGFQQPPPPRLFK